MLRRILSSLGFGSPKVKLWLPSNILLQGETQRGMIYVDGGKAVYQIQQVYLHLEVTSQFEKENVFTGINDVIDSITIQESFTVDGAHFWEEVPFEYTIPLNLPVTHGWTRFELLAGLSIDNAINPYDRLAVTIKPSAGIEAMFEIFSEIGLKHRNDSGSFDGKIQSFYFLTGELSANGNNYLKTVFKNDSDKLYVFLETDERPLPTIELPVQMLTHKNIVDHEAKNYIKEFISLYL